VLFSRRLASRLARHFAAPSRLSLSSLSSLLLPLLLLSACSSPPRLPVPIPPACTPADAGLKSNTLRVATVDSTPPYAWHDRSGWHGVEPDLARALAARFGARLKITAYPPDQLLPALLDDQVDLVMAGLPVRPDWLARADFAPPYFSTGLALAVRPQSLPALNTPRRIQNAALRVAAADPSSTDFLARYLPRATPVPADSLPEALRAVDMGLADAAIGDAPSLLASIRAQRLHLALAPSLLNATDLAWALRPGRSRLREQLHLALRDWQSNGTLRALLSPHLPLSP
jgi:ABC-type amino acid transport substrate-binding protein